MIRIKGQITMNTQLLDQTISLYTLYLDRNCDKNKTDFFPRKKVMISRRKVVS